MSFGMRDITLLNIYIEQWCAAITSSYGDYVIFMCIISTLSAADISVSLGQRQRGNMAVY